MVLLILKKWIYFNCLSKILGGNDLEYKVSVVIPTYNGEEFIDDTINCLKNQRYKMQKLHSW